MVNACRTTGFYSAALLRQSVEAAGRPKLDKLDCIRLITSMTSDVQPNKPPRRTLDVDWKRNQDSCGSRQHFERSRVVGMRVEFKFNGIGFP